MIAISRFRLRATQSVEEFLVANATYQDRFVYRQPGIVRRTMTTGLDGEWASFTLWRSMADARNAKAAADESPVALSFHELIDSTTCSTEYFKELPG